MSQADGTITDPGEAQVAVAKAVFANLDGIEWSRAFAFAVEASTLLYWNVIAFAADGSVIIPSRSLARGVDEPFQRLRRALADPRSGAWLAAFLELQPDGRFSFDFEWERRPWLGGRGEERRREDLFRESGAVPSDDAWVEDFRRFPRAPERMPAWAAALIEADSASTGQDPAVLFRKVLKRDPSWPRHLKPLFRDGRWTQIGEAVHARVREALLSGRYNRLMTDRDAQRARVEMGILAQDVFGTVLSQDLATRDAGFLIDLWSAWATQSGKPAPDGLASIDRSQSLAQELTGPLEDVGDDVADVLGDLVRADLEGRFGIEPA